jgi:hypothetical protein
MASGGIWKSTNKGTTWTPIFENQPVSTFGDLTIAPSNPEVLWAGTGEQNNRQSTSWGNGVYRSLDGGETWTHLGLDETRHISRVLVHPDDPDVAFIGALGTLWAPSEDRGVFKTTDGGHTWSRVLFVDAFTGIIDMEMDPANPNTLYAANTHRQGSDTAVLGADCYAANEIQHHPNIIEDGEIAKMFMGQTWARDLTDEAEGAQRAHRARHRGRNVPNGRRGRVLGEGQRPQPATHVLQSHHHRSDQ